MSAASESCPYTYNEICQSYCAPERRLCDEVSAFELFFSGIQRIQEVRDQALIEANTDKLTGLLNKAAMFTAGEQAVQTAEMGGNPFGVIMLDISYFKRYNDTKGHLAGDNLLARVGSLLRGLLRDEDQVTARFGGDEFVMLCGLTPREPDQPRAPYDRLIAITERLQQEVDLTLAAEDGYLRGAFGASVWEPGETFEDVLVRADDGMYKNKRRQKNSLDDTEPND